MRIVIAGAGITGEALARLLVQNGNDVTLIELSDERARHIANRLDCMVVSGDGRNHAVLKEAGIEKADVLVCLMSSDEMNILTCSMAQLHAPNCTKIARVRNQAYTTPDPEGGIIRFPGVDHVIDPTVEAVHRVLAAIEHNAAGDVLSFAGTDYELGSIEVQSGSGFDGLALKDYRTLVQGETLVTLLERDGSFILPSGSTVLAAGDRVYILAKEKGLDSLFDMGGLDEEPVRKIGIAGGGHSGSLIAEGLFAPDKGGTDGKSVFSFLKRLVVKNRREIVIIEQDYAICKKLAERFPQAIVLNEDISDENFVVEERLGGLDIMITATGNQELNVITALYLKSAGIKRAVAMVATSGYATIARRLGVDVAVPVKSVVVDSILGRLFGGSVLAVRRLGDGSIAAFEIEITRYAPIAGTPITKLKLSTGVLVMLVHRNGQAFIPTGGYVFQPADRVTLLAQKSSEKEIEKLFALRHEV